jgi:FlaG/FlaF family flagellin (archaellin)
MKNTLLVTILAAAMSSLAFGQGSTSQAPAKKTKPSAEHTAAIKKCNDDYKAAVKEAKTKKGQERKDAMAAATKARKDCIAAAPQ